MYMAAMSEGRFIDPRGLVDGSATVDEGNDASDGAAGGGVPATETRKLGAAPRSTPVW